MELLGFATLSILCFWVGLNTQDGSTKKLLKALRDWHTKSKEVLDLQNKNLKQKQEIIERQENLIKQQ
jgi:phosphomevalonate kinase